MRMLKQSLLTPDKRMIYLKLCESPIGPLTMSSAKKAIFTFIAVVFIPALFFLLLEGVLRLVGNGTHYDYFNEITIDDKLYYQDNKAFANQFYPPSLGVAPLNNTISAEDSDDVVRVFVLGGSAAQGFPHVNHGLDRHLGAHLKAALPGKKIEIVNTAMTSVNSHVVYEVARTLPKNSADFAVVLMGNNEVVGPYGPSTFSQNFLSSLTMIRMLQRLKRTHTWQAIAAFIQSVKADSTSGDIEWEGMQMFSGFNVTNDDARLKHVYSHYENNLRDIIKLLQDKGMHVVVSSVPVNLRHSAPFGSVHKSTLTEDELQQWQRDNRLAEDAFNSQNWQQAIGHYRALIEIDNAYADSHFRLATALEKIGQYEQAKEHFQAALRYDTKRFRTDSVINEIIEKVTSQASGGITYVDSVAVFEQASKPHAAGWNLLHEHVHFDFSGNYLLAREFSNAIVQKIEPGRSTRSLTPQQAAELIGFPNHETNQVMNRLLGMVKKSPFTEQSNFSELEAFTAKRRDEIVEEVGSPQDVIKRRDSIVSLGKADWKIHYELAELQRFVRNREASLHHLRTLVDLYPHNHESYLKLAEYLSPEGELEQANRYLKQSLFYARNDGAKITQALGWIGLNYMKMGNYNAGRDFLEQVIDDHPDQIGSTIRAYGSLIKYSLENEESSDFRRYIAGVKRYAKMLIDQERVDEFPLLYRRMAQIMTIAGEKAEAQRWQNMQASNKG